VAAMTRTSTARGRLDGPFALQTVQKGVVARHVVGEFASPIAQGGGNDFTKVRRGHKGFSLDSARNLQHGVTHVVFNV